MSLAVLRQDFESKKRIIALWSGRIVEYNGASARLLTYLFHVLEWNQKFFLLIGSAGLFKRKCTKSWQNCVIQSQILSSLLTKVVTFWCCLTYIFMYMIWPTPFICISMSTKFYIFQDDTMESSKEGFVIRVVLLQQVKKSLRPILF